MILNFDECLSLQKVPPSVCLSQFCWLDHEKKKTHVFAAFQMDSDGRQMAAFIKSHKCSLPEVCEICKKKCCSSSGSARGEYMLILVFRPASTQLHMCIRHLWWNWSLGCSGGVNRASKRCTSRNSNVKRAEFKNCPAFHLVHPLVSQSQGRRREREKLPARDDTPLLGK